MTEKRFTHEKWYNERKIKENGELFAIIDVYNQADKICNRLNELFDENELLKYMNGMNRSELLDLEYDMKKLEEENEQLKKDLKKQFVPFAKADGDYTTVNTEEFIKILNENEQLKQEKQELFLFFMEHYDQMEDELIEIEIKLEERIKELDKENEQLKKELKVYRKIATCSNCNYHNYDWFDDGDEFEVCDKGNDTSNRICEDWEEL